MSRAPHCDEGEREERRDAPRGAHPRGRARPLAVDGVPLVHLAGLGPRLLLLKVHDAHLKVGGLGLYRAEQRGQVFAHLRLRVPRHVCGGGERTRAGQCERCTYSGPR